jgi:hypothetical protein
VNPLGIYQPLYTPKSSPCTPKMSRFSRSQQPAATTIPSIFHAAASRRLAQARATNSASPSPSSSALSAVGYGSQELPEGDYSVVGERFKVDFEHVNCNGERLYGPRLSYRVKHKSQLKGACVLAPIWRYGVELSYLEDDGTRLKLWLCRQCHLSRKPNDTRAVNGTAHIAEHLKRVHRIDPATGLLPETPSKPPYSSPFEAAAGVPGSGAVGSHSPWQEDAFQAALVDWVIVRDISLATAVCPATRGLLTWNRTALLDALPNCRTTLSRYVLKTLDERKIEVGALLQAARQDQYQC